MRVNPSFRSCLLKRFTAWGLISLLLLVTAAPAFTQMRVSGVSAGKKSASNKKAAKLKSSRVKKSKKDDSEKAEIIPERITVEKSAEIATSDIMADQAARGIYKSPRQILFDLGVKRKKERPNRENLPEGPGALEFNKFPYPADDETDNSKLDLEPMAPQSLGIQFNGATGPTDTGAFPPDTMAAVGPTQLLVQLNGRIRTFNKTTGIADGVMNVDSDVFFAPITTPPAAGQVTFTTDPMVRFDRLSGRWFMNMIDVTIVTATGAIARANRVLIAVSSTSTITGATIWTLYQFQGDATLFTDYQSFGVDAGAMYIGGNMFTIAGAFNSTKGFVIPKAPAIAGSALTVWAFAGLVATAAGAGPFSPRGCDNPDPLNTGVTATGYFIGVDNATFNTLMIRRVTNPGSLGPAPTISGNISIPTTLTTSFPVKVPHLGNTGGINGRLDALDDRLYSATIRNGRLWTAHNIGVSNLGTTPGPNRNASRWYEIQNLSTATPTVFQAGTLFDNNILNDVNQRNYWIPSIMVSGQGHAAMGTSIAGTNERANAFTTGRLVGDTLGTLRDGPGGVLLPGYTASAFAYNPPGDPGSGGGRRWGDYSFTSLDPLDDMTMWTIQQYTNGLNTYGVRAVQLIAPPPVMPNTASATSGLASTNVMITGPATLGRGFYDPGPNLAAPAVPFNHITASVSGTNVIVTSVTYNSPTQITLNLNTLGAAAGARTLTITNPDGQQSTGILDIMTATAALANLSGRVRNAFGRGIGRVVVRVTSADGSVNRTAISNPFGYYRFNDLPTGDSYIITPSHKRYNFDPPALVYTHLDEFASLDFVAETQ